MLICRKDKYKEINTDAKINGDRKTTTDAFVN